MEDAFGLHHDSNANVACIYNSPKSSKEMNVMTFVLRKSRALSCPKLDLKKKMLFLFWANNI